MTDAESILVVDPAECQRLWIDRRWPRLKRLFVDPHVDRIRLQDKDLDHAEPAVSIRD